MKIKLAILFIIITSFLMSSCNKCGDTDIPFEGFDVAVVDELKQSLVGPDKRYQVEDVMLEVDGENIIYGYYEKNNIYYFLIDYSQLKNMNAECKLMLSQNTFIPIDFTITKDFSHCYPHNVLSQLTIDGLEYELREQILIYK